MLGGDGANCIPGCSPVGKQCPDVGHDWSCSFASLRAALEAQQNRDSYKARNNEVVVNFESMRKGLPDTLQGFFYMRTSKASDELVVRNAHQAFLKEFGLGEADGPPLLELDLSSAGVRGAPFRLAPAKQM